MKFFSLLPLFTYLLLTTSTSAQTWEFVQSIEVSDLEAQDNLGFAVWNNDSIITVGAWFEDGAPNNEVPESGAAYVLKKQLDGSWLEWGKLNSPNPENLGYFGSAVTMSTHHIVVGAYNEDHLEEDFFNSGNVYLFDTDDLGIDTILFATEPTNADYFGYSVAAHGDYLLVGAYGEDEDINGENTLEDAGAAYLYQYIDSILFLRQKLVASDRGMDDNFGKYLDITEDRIIISAFRNTDEANFFSEAGAAYIFEKQSDGNWIEVQKLLASDINFFDQFGWDVAIDGDWAMVGARNSKNAPDGSLIPNIGTVYVFHRQPNGSWEEVQKLFAEDYAANDLFGGAIDIDGNVAIIGADWEDEDANGENTISAAGSAYIYELDEDNNWKQITKVVGENRNINDWFGTAVSICGPLALVGARSADGPNGNLLDAGAAYLFERDQALSATNIHSNNSLQIFPNPSFGRLVLRTTIPIYNNAQAQVYNALGVLVHTTTVDLSHQLVEIDLSTFSGGMYWVSIQQNGKVLGMQKCIITK